MMMDVDPNEETRIIKKEEIVERPCVWWGKARRDKEKGEKMTEYNRVGCFDCNGENTACTYFCGL